MYIEHNIIYIHVHTCSTIQLNRNGIAFVVTSNISLGYKRVCLYHW